MFLAVTKLVLENKKEQQQRIQQQATDTVRLGERSKGGKGKKGKCCWYLHDIPLININKDLIIMIQHIVTSRISQLSV